MLVAWLCGFGFNRDVIAGNGGRHCSKVATVGFTKMHFSSTAGSGRIAEVKRRWL